MRLQQPTVSAEMSFLLAVLKFYVPAAAVSASTPIPWASEDVLLTGALPEQGLPSSLSLAHLACPVLPLDVAGRLRLLSMLWPVAGACCEGCESCLWVWMRTHRSLSAQSQ